MAESRNSITIGSIHHEEINNNDDKDMETSRYKKDLPLIEHQYGHLDRSEFFFIDERDQESRQLIRRYIVRVQESQHATTTGKFDAFETESPT
jgi:hypothetical protein